MPFELEDECDVSPQNLETSLCYTLKCHIMLNEVKHLSGYQRILGCFSNEEAYMLSTDCYWNAVIIRQPISAAMPSSMSQRAMRWLVVSTSSRRLVFGPGAV